MRDIERRDGEYLQENEIDFNASFIVGGQIGGEPLRLFRIYAEGNFIEAGVDTPYFQTGETKYGKPIIDRVITRVTPLADATKCVLVSFDSTMRSNLSVGMPIDLICYERDSLEVQKRRRFDDGDRLLHRAQQAMERRHAPGVSPVARVALVIGRDEHLRSIPVHRRTTMQIRVGFEMIYDCPQPTPMIFNLNVHFTRVSDLVGRDDLLVRPARADRRVSRQLRQLVQPHRGPEGPDARLRQRDSLNDTGAPDVIVPQAKQLPVQDLPEETLLFLLGSRYCETDRLSETAWNLFGQAPTGWDRVQAICDYVHRHITFGYEHARMTRTALEAFHDKTGVCRDYAHLAVAFCRCMNIPARYCTGYLGDIGMPPPYGPMDFAAWFEAFLDGHWYTFDARNNMPRIGRVLIARGRDASDVAISSTFGPNTLTSFKVWTDEVRPS